MKTFPVKWVWIFVGLGVFVAIYTRFRFGSVDPNEIINTACSNLAQSKECGPVVLLGFVFEFSVVNGITILAAGITSVIMCVLVGTLLKALSE